jgi:cbb3-type cytochrome oxidase subunit 3
MIISGWFNIAVTGALAMTLVTVAVYYYRPKHREQMEHDEQPKYRMLDDEDEKSS